MRVLFTISPAKSIFLTMVPLAWALRTAGHDVRVASQPSFADTITQAGLTAVPVGRHADMFRLMDAAGLDQERLEQARPGLSAPYDVIEHPDDADWDELLPAYAELVTGAFKYETFPMLSSLVEFARHWQPDLVVWEPFTYAGPIVAKVCGAAHARLLWSVDVFGHARRAFLRLKAAQPPEDRGDPLAEWLDAYTRRYGGDGFTEDMADGQFTIDQFPPSLQNQTPGLHYVRMQYIPYGGPAVVPKWLWAPPRRPRVALTMGLTATEMFAGYTFNLQDVLDALADLDIEVVATIAAEQQRRLDRVPDNARLIPYVPLHALAPTCSVVINHAGAATFATVARYGVPQLLMPYHFDEPLFARGLVEQGAALALPHGETSGANVRERLLRLMREPSFTEGAGWLREEILAQPTPNELVPQLEELTEKCRTRVR